MEWWEQRGQQPPQAAPQEQRREQDEQQQQQQAQAALPPPPPSPTAAATAADIIRHSCDMLALPARVACTALTFLHRVDPQELPAEHLAAACLFLAAKVEEASVRTNDMLNAVAAWGRRTDAAALAAFPCLVGEAYQARKRQLITDEQLVLRRLRFDIGCDQPHRHLYALAHCWGASRDAVRVAACLLNDGLCRCPAYASPAMQPATAAAAALHVAAQLCSQAVQPPGWWRATGITDAELQAACGMLLDVLQA